jgi:hypothetical protein
MSSGYPALVYPIEIEQAVIKVRTLCED